MKIQPIKKIDEHNAKRMFLWLNDPTNRFYCTVCKDPNALPRFKDWREFMFSMNSSDSIRYGIYDQGDFVGEFSFSFDHPALLKKEPKTAWVGIGIGEESARGKGAGTAAMKHVESEASKLGAERIELGVFEFNRPAIRLYEKLQYLHFDTIPDFTWWEGKWWADLRYEKFLPKARI